MPFREPKNGECRQSQPLSMPVNSSTYNVNTLLGAESIRQSPQQFSTQPLDQRPIYNRSFAIAFFSQFLFVGANSLLAHYARWIEFLGGSVRDVGWILGIAALAAFGFRPWIGGWINRFGARHVWQAGLVMSAISLLANLILSELNGWVYVFRIGFLVGIGLGFTGGLTFIAQTAPSHRRTEAISVFGAAGFFGMFSGPLLGDVLLGSDIRTMSDFVRLFTVASAAIFAGAVMLCFLRTPQIKTREALLGLKGFLKTVQLYWPGAVVLVSVVFGMCLTVPFGFLTSYVDKKGLTFDTLPAVGVFFLAYGGWGLLIRLGLSWLPDRIGRRKVLIAGLLLISLGMFSFLIVTPQQPWYLLVPGFVCGTGHALCFPSINSLILGPFPNHLRGTGSTLALMITDFGVIAGAPLLGMIAEWTEYSGLFITAGCTSLTTAILFWYLTLPIWRERNRLAHLATQVDACLDNQV